MTNHSLDYFLRTNDKILTVLSFSFRMSLNIQLKNMIMLWMCSIKIICVFTGMHNDRGGYENDCLLIRRAENR